MSSLAKQALSPPNLVTYVRILAIPGVLVIMEFDSPRNAFLAAMIFAIASATDALDGWLARRFNLTSVLGKLLDPLADKLIVLGTLIMLLHLGRVNAWIVFILLARDILINGLRTIAMGEGLVIAARDLGKQKTAFQMVGVWCLLVHYKYELEPLPDPVDFHRIGTVLLYISVFFSVVSAIDYFAGFFRTMSRRERGEPDSEEDVKNRVEPKEHRAAAEGAGRTGR
ncbi:CDP-diacylglycerol--glycerol-3-phosphate 3-phosphatidyltransferase [Myxococcota bacterium]|nr:CDP-diacylglycerol--glycerol-3-phosphate 3-phosphatidyltransferase [Myxococcota bacterium]